MSQRPAVLFACTLNRTRSPMAEGLARKLFGESVTVDSCGVEPAEAFDPFMLAVLGEVGATITERPGKGFEALNERVYDLIVSLSPDAHRTAQRLGAERGVAVKCWPVADPTHEEGSRDQVLQAYREVRRDLEERIRGLFQGAIDLKGSNGV